MSDQLSMVALGTPHASLCAIIHGECFPAEERWGNDAFLSLLQSPGIMGWMAMRGAEPAGFMLARLCLDEAEILTLAVRPSQQRNGVGRLLVHQTAVSLRDMGAGTVFLEVSVRNAPALSLYRRSGYISCGTRRRYYPDGSDASVLRQDLRREIQ
ncbi:GNAT family N-acetyltransferase [Asaia lannensis]|uniref:GNAT family N-acetyltransferase n=1 Tax=Asaia lannensis NBRC 102526 TaxID=1307926 RepID=A0ABT1CCG6_9PROT|nr:GNAT family N-acetyltransferase [Asaia lannensis]MCO6158560.1 GNAT family N-acetyltransferase [Asaia lannensis NBRC 102526]